ncbi:MAG: recombinase zinc beta ribbon domain-containing protein [Anaerolineae bacterium]|nr:recombinase zinc beta ribbon domain-containing protein [Anaerolineae bacterium]
MWKPPTDTAIYEIVRNPAYAGAFVWAAPHAGTAANVRGRRPKRNGSPLCDVYPAYIRGRSTKRTRRSWSGMDSAPAVRSSAVGATREGPGLLQGLAVCGHCGYHRQVMYKEGYHHYPCQNMRRRYGVAACPTIHGPRVDAAVTQAFFAACARPTSTYWQRY